VFALFAEQKMGPDELLRKTQETHLEQIFELNRPAQAYLMLFHELLLPIRVVTVWQTIPHCQIFVGKFGQP
jgi:hypothetical protein